MKYYLLGLLVVVLLFFAGLGLKVVLFPVAKISNAVETAYDVNSKVMTGDNAIKSYTYFLDQENAIKAKYQDEAVALKAIDNYKADLSTDKSKWTDSDKNELSRLQTVSDAIQYQLNSMIGDYNAKSANVTMNIWKDNLPSTMSRAFLANQKYSN